MCLLRKNHLKPFFVSVTSWTFHNSCLKRWVFSLTKCQDGFGVMTIGLLTQTAPKTKNQSIKQETSSILNFLMDVGYTHVLLAKMLPVVSLLCLSLYSTRLHLFRTGYRFTHRLLPQPLLLGTQKSL